MSTMTATDRGTPSLSIATTQNTAPVHEYRCMFSHDLRKKKKTWHDGFLRFHTFNKRVMVYDDVKNFIGDLHYRTADEFGEGTELQLNKGVLVQVEDRIGQTETNLAPLLDKRRPAADSNVTAGQLAALAPSLLRTNLAYSQGRPKSLSAVLGVSQGPIGRARLPPRSPYERLHHISSLAAADEPPAKRQRTVTDKENQKEGEGTAPRRETVKRKTREVETLGRRKSPLSELRQNTKTPDVVDILSDDEHLGSTAASARLAERVPSYNAKVKKAREPAPASRSAAKLSKPKRDRIPPSELLSSLPRDDSFRSNSSADNVMPWVRPSLPGKTQLRFAAEKVRPKLMYCALLPNLRRLSGATARPLVGSGKERGSKRPRSTMRNADTTSNAARDNMQVANDIFDVDDVGGLEVGDLQARPPDTSNVTPVRSAAHSRSVMSSPLFCAPGSADKEGGDLRLFSQGDLIIPSSMEEPVAEFPTRPPAPPKTGTTAIQEGSGERDQDSIRQPIVSDKLTLMDRRLLMPPPAPVTALPEQLQQSLKTRLFRRVLSEGDLPASHEPGEAPRSNVPTALESMKVRQARAPKVQQVYKSPTKLQRSVSDISGLVSPAKAAVKPNEVEITQETGPWTSMEAYLLFDWWPQGRKRPSYGDTGQRGAGRTNNGRGVLRDEANVL